MKKKLSLLILFFLFWFQKNQAQTEPPFVKDRLIVKLRKEQTAKITQLNVWQKLPRYQQIKDIQTIYAAPISAKATDNTESNFLSSMYRIQFAPGQNIQTLIQLYQASGLFEYVEPDYLANQAGTTEEVEGLRPNDTYYYNRQWSHYNDATFTQMPSRKDADIDMDLAWQIQKGDTNVIVAILDTGINPNHPDFKGRLWRNKIEKPDNTTDDDQNGLINDLYGWDFINRDNQPLDDNGHGTNVSGLLAANGNNAIGYAGVDWNCKLLVCKVLDAQGVGAYSNIAQGVIYAVNQGAHVINMSLGGAGSSQLLQDAIEYARLNDVLVVASMMNYNNSTPYYPAAYPSTIAVGSTDADDSRSAPFFWSTSSGSNYGNHIDVVAPGNYMYGLHHLNNNYYGSYWGGTSQATPLVSGLAALLIAQKTYISIEEIREILHLTAEDQVGDPKEDVKGWDIYHGFGRINAQKALMINRNAVPLAIKNLYLINTNNDKVIKKMLPFDKIGYNVIDANELSFKAELSLDVEGSIYFELSGPINHIQIENIAPYTLFGDAPWSNILGKTLTPGKYTLKATPYTKINRQGIPGTPLLIQFELVDNIAAPLKSFSLLDADKKAEILQMYDGIKLNLNQLNTRKLSIQANNTDNPASVGLWLEGEFGHQQTENLTPYVLFGDSTGGLIHGESLCPGKYRLIAIPYSGKYLTGERGQSINIDFEVIGEYYIEQLTLVNAITDQDIRTLPLDGNVVLQLNNLPARINIRADAKCAQSVDFVITKTGLGVIKKQTENLAPFAAWGDDNRGDYYSWYPQAGFYTLSYTSYSQKNAQGEPGHTDQLNIEILNQASLAHQQEDIVRIFPNSSDNKITISLQTSTLDEEKAIVEIYDYTGRRIISRLMTSGQSEEIFLRKYGTGMYFARIIKGNQLFTSKIFIE
ncbi:MAG: S8 family serine peptidase [Microscillaceae bacterium]|nr:S8 family serine peptidase [Microscillaceae bacterium]